MAGSPAENRHEAFKKPGLFYRLGQVCRESLLLEPDDVAVHAERAHHHQHGIGHSRIILDHFAEGLSVGLRHKHVEDGDAERVS
jgi:hypothetical protein